MISTKKTLDYLLSDTSKESNTSDNNKNTKKKQKKGDRQSNPPPTIPPSPKTKHDETCATDLLLRKFELDASNETWLQNTVANKSFQNTNTINKQISQFNLNTNKYSYQSFITHTKPKINEYLSEGTSLHIVTNFTDIGCPVIKNKNVKKGCWCIQQTKKIIKPKIIKPKIGTIKPTAITLTHNPLLTKQQLNIMEYFKTFNVQNTIPTTTNNNHIDLMQKNLILNARTQQYMNSNRMQQIRMQQMLLNARSNGVNNSLNNGLLGINNISNKSVLGVRTHKDTIVFNNKAKNNSNQTGEPPVKRRKKTRWSNK